MALCSLRFSWWWLVVVVVVVVVGRDKLASGNYLSLVNVLMQLRKVCNHPELFEERPVVSSLDMGQSLSMHVPSAVVNMLAYVRPRWITFSRPLPLVLVAGPFCVELAPGTLPPLERLRTHPVLCVVCVVWVWVWVVLL